MSEVQSTPSLQELLISHAPIAMYSGQIRIGSGNDQLVVGQLNAIPEQDQACITFSDRLLVSYNFCKEASVGAMVGGTVKIGDASVVSSEAQATTQRDALVQALTAIHNSASSLDTSMAAIRALAQQALALLH